VLRPIVSAGKSKPAIFEIHIRDLLMETKIPYGSSTAGSLWEPDFLAAGILQQEIVVSNDLQGGE
jgi:hypothetical protein